MKYEAKRIDMNPFFIRAHMATYIHSHVFIFTTFVRPCVPKGPERVSFLIVLISKCAGRIVTNEVAVRALGLILCEVKAT